MKIRQTQALWVMALCAMPFAPCIFAVDGGADYGRGRETDPVAGAALITETNRAIVAEAALSTRIVTETNRAQVAEGAINAAVFASVAVVSTPVSTTQATITVTCKDLAGNTLAAAKNFEFWFTTYAQSTIPSTNGIRAFSYVAHGSIDAYRYSSTAVVGYIGKTHTDGTMDFLVDADAGPSTNMFAVFGPNGSYTNLEVKFQAP